jgi:hypothetical protein
VQLGPCGSSQRSSGRQPLRWRRARRGRVLRPDLPLRRRRLPQAILALGMPRLEGRLCGLSVAAENGVSTTSGPNLPLSSVGDSLARAGLPFGGVHRWLMAHGVQPVVGPEADDEHAEPQAWLKVMCLTGVDDPLRRALIFTARYGTQLIRAPSTGIRRAWRGRGRVSDRCS